MAELAMKEISKIILFEPTNGAKSENDEKADSTAPFLQKNLVKKLIHLQSISCNSSSLWNIT